MTPLRPRDAWLLAFALFSFLSFPQQFGEVVFDFGWGMAWLGPACLLLGVHGLAPRAAALRALLAGGVAYAAILYWFYVVSVVYGHAPAVAGVAASLGAGLGMAGFVAAFAAAQRWLSARGCASPFSAAIVWTVLEHLRSVFPVSGFPWATLGYAQHENGPLLGLSTLTGVYGLSFVTVLGGAALAAFLQTAHLRRAGRPAASLAVPSAALLLVCLMAIVGQALRPDADPLARTLRVAAVQGNIDQAAKWSPKRAGEIMDRYEVLSRRAAERGAEVIVWPETAVPGAVEFDAPLRQRLQQLARETGSLLVVGGVGISASEARAEEYLYFDSAFVITAGGSIADRYDKTHLVPFGEYVPLRWLLGGLLDAIATGIAPQDVTQGEAPRALLLSLEGDSAAHAVIRAGVPICYELLFPDLVRRFADDGAQLLLAITNDAWYGRTGAPHQFLAMTAMRSAESGLWTVRAANTGVSAIIDGRGRVLERTQLYEQAVLVADVPLAAADGQKNFYVRHGNVFALFCWLGLAVHFLAARLGFGRTAERMIDR